MLNSIQLARVDLNLLVLFSVVLEEQHVGRAAARLNLTASAVSHSLARLRELLHDPLFLRTPKGVVPTARALELNQPIADILARVDGVLKRAAPFDPTISQRRFVIGAPDAVLAAGMSPLMTCIAREAPYVDVGLVHLMPTQRESTLKGPWQHCLDKLEIREIDVAVLPLRSAPVRFAARKLYEEDFVVAMRKGHAFARARSEAAFCKARHLLVSIEGGPVGFVDEIMAKRGLERRVALTVPSFMMALFHLSCSNLIAALPRRLVREHAAQFGLTAVDLPFEREPDLIQVITTQAAMKDAGISWLVDRLIETFAART